MEMGDLVMPHFDIPITADAPGIPPETYARWIWQNIARLRESGRLDELCMLRTPVNSRFTLIDPAGGTISVSSQ